MCIRDRMRNARRVLGNAAVVGERRYRFSVLEARRAQSKPLGFEDGDTALVEGLSRYFFQQCHGTGSSLKCEEGEPASRLPLSEPIEPCRFDEMPADLDFWSTFYSAAASVIGTTDT